MCVGLKLWNLKCPRELKGYLVTDLNHRTGLSQVLQLSSAGLQSESLATVTLHFYDSVLSKRVFCHLFVCLFPLLNFVIKLFLQQEKSNSKRTCVPTFDCKMETNLVK